MVSNPTDLTKPAMPTYLANRGRGRGTKGSSLAPAQRLPNLMAEKATAEAKEEGNGA